MRKLIDRLAFSTTYRVALVALGTTEHNEAAPGPAKVPRMVLILRHAGRWPHRVLTATSTSRGSGGIRQESCAIRLNQTHDRHVLRDNELCPGELLNSSNTHPGRQLLEHQPMWPGLDDGKFRHD
jgi:hypothetical protein